MRFLKGLISLLFFGIGILVGILEIIALQLIRSERKWLTIPIRSEILINLGMFTQLLFFLR